jgi:DnaJ-class molecular chaperone
MNGGNQGNAQNVHINVDELFKNLFAGGMGPGIQIFHNGVNINLQKPPPIIMTIDVPIDKILSGTTMPVEIERWIMQNNVKTLEKEIMYINIPKGIDEGEIIILRDKGNVGQNDLKGDIKLFIRINNTTEFKRHGLDLLLEKTILLKEALCGFTFELKHLSGKSYTINNNPGSIISPGYQKVIPNLGFTRDQHVGNLVVIFNIKFPEKLDEKVLEQLKQLEF